MHLGILSLKYTLKPHGVLQLRGLGVKIEIFMRVPSPGPEPPDEGLQSAPPPVMLEETVVGSLMAPAKDAPPQRPHPPELPRRRMDSVPAPPQTNTLASTQKMPEWDGGSIQQHGQPFLDFNQKAARAEHNAQ